MTTAATGGGMLWFLVTWIREGGWRLDRGSLA
jgi:hypothetical protein